MESAPAVPAENGHTEKVAEPIVAAAAAVVPEAVSKVEVNADNSSSTPSGNAESSGDSTIPPPLPTIPPPSQVMGFAESAMSGLSGLATSQNFAAPKIVEQVKEQVAAAVTEKVEKTVTDVKVEAEKKVEEVAAAVEEVKTEVQHKVEEVKAAVEEKVQEVVAAVTEAKGEVEHKIEETKAAVEEKVEQVAAAVTEAKVEAEQKVEEVKAAVEEKQEAIAETVSKVEEQIQEIQKEAETVKEEVTEKVAAELEAAKEAAVPVVEQVLEAATEKVQEAVVTSPGAEQIAEAIATIEKVTDGVLSSDESADNLQLPSPPPTAAQSVADISDDIPPPPEPERDDLSVDVSSPLPQQSLESLPSPPQLSQSDSLPPPPPADSAQESQTSTIEQPSVDAAAEDKVNRARAILIRKKNKQSKTIDVCNLIIPNFDRFYWFWTKKFHIQKNISKKIIKHSKNCQNLYRNVTPEQKSRKHVFAD